MKNLPVDPAPVPKTLADQKTDFTAEGSPPPGKVATTEPVVVGPEAATPRHLARRAESRRKPLKGRALPRPRR